MARTAESVQFNPSSERNVAMAFKLVVFAALLAAANAGYLGAPAALSYAAAPAHVGYAAAAPAHVSYAAPAVAYAHGPVASTAVGSHTQSVYRSHDGNHAVSTYSKAVDTAFSSVRKYDTRVSNDAVAFAPAVAHAPVAYAAPAVATYAAHAPAVATTYAAHAPAIATTYAAHAPAVAYSAAPAYAKAGLLGVAYSAAPAVAHISYSNGAGYNYHY